MRIAGDRPLDEMVGDVLEAAESEGWLEELLTKARKRNPGSDLRDAVAVVYPELADE